MPAATYQIYAGDGTNRNFGVPFPYLARDHVKVRINGVQTTAFSWLNDSMLQMTVAPAGGAVVDVRRVTPSGAPPVDFENGSVLADTELDLVSVYSSYLSEEARDFASDSLRADYLGTLSARSMRISGVADGVASTDAVNKGQMDTIFNADVSALTALRNQTADLADDAEASQVAATNSKTSAAGSATAAAASALVASTAKSNTETLRDSFVAVMGGYGYQPPAAYAAGLAMSMVTQTVYYAGSTYAPLLSALPFTTGASFDPAKWRLIQGIATADLAATSGSGLVGFDGGSVQDVLDASKPMQSYTALRSYTGRATGIRVTTLGKAGVFQRDASDTTSADNGGTILVDASGRRWKRVFEGSVDVRWFGAVADGVTDMKAALEAAIATGRPVRIPDGAYYLANPIVPVEGMALRGDSEIPVQLTRGTHIYAPNGFTYHTGARIRCEIYGIRLRGNNTPGVHGLYGKMGGLFEGLALEQFDSSVINQQSYLSTYRRCKFFRSNRGLWLNETNLVNVYDCHFDGDVLTQIDNQTLTPGGSLVGGTGLNIIGTNFNIVGTTLYLAKLTQSINFERNYVEVYSAMPAGGVLIDYLADRFSYSQLDIHNNSFNGQNNCDRALQIYSNNSAGTIQSGRVQDNYMRGFLQRPILVGNKSGGFNIVTGIDFDRNQANQAQAVEFTHYMTPRHQAIRASYTTGTMSVAGSAFLFPVLTDQIARMGGDFTALSGTAWKAGSAGLYHIDMTVNLKSQSGDLFSQEIALVIDGATVEQRFVPIIRNAEVGNRYVSATISGVYALNASSTVQIGVRNGDILHRATLSAFRIGDDCYYKV